eukprot:GHVN01055619.1.p1 GENE.GHVN01055619.1~~GHVN01055619.1.p1  ORF type:complete len:630 (+),score=105.79 GHVN01055619.1:284-1891(+)
MAYQGTVCLPQEVLKGKMKFPPVLTAEGEARHRGLQSHRSSRNDPPLSARGTYPSGQQMSYRSNGSMQDRGIRIQGPQGNQFELPDHVTPEMIQKTVEKFDHFFDYDTVVKKLQSSKDLNATITELVNEHLTHIAEAFGEQKISELACEGKVMQMLQDGTAKTKKHEMTFLEFVNQIRNQPPSTKAGKNYGPQTAQKVPTGLRYEHSGYKKSLLVGVNYFRQQGELAGCIHDVERIKTCINKLYRFPDDPRRMTCLTDDNQDPRLQPTRANILNGFRWLTEGAEPGDALFFHFSGHGAQVPAKNRYEVDGLDETILPVDYARAGMILDEEIHELLVQPLPLGVKIVCVMDCCHSGTAIDLSHQYNLQSRSFTKVKNPFITPNDTILLSGSRDNQTSADVGGNSKYEAGGAMTTTLITILAQNPYEMSTDELMDKLHYKLASHGFSQRPCLSASQSYDTSEPFSFTKININQNSVTGRSAPKPITTIVPPPSSRSKCCVCAGPAASSKIDPTADVSEFVTNQVMGYGTGVYTGEKK